MLDRVLDGCELSDASPLSDAQMWQLCDEVKTFLLAGHETTASTLIWSIYEVGWLLNEIFLLTLPKAAPPPGGHGPGQRGSGSPLSSCTVHFLFALLLKYLFIIVPFPNRTARASTRAASLPASHSPKPSSERPSAFTPSFPCWCGRPLRTTSLRE